MRRLIAALALGATVVACSEQATAPQPGTPAIAANFINHPVTGNPQIFRYQSDYFAAWTDPSNGLRGTHRTQPASGMGNCFEFAPAGAADWNEHVKGSPDDWASRWMANVQADVWITVRDVTKPGSCAGNLLIAEGWGRLQYDDNDEAAGYNLDRNNADSWSFRGTGTLTAPDGKKVQYNGHYHLVWTRDPAPYGTVLNETFQVNAH